MEGSTVRSRLSFISNLLSITDMRIIDNEFVQLMMQK